MRQYTKLTLSLFLAGLFLLICASLSVYAQISPNAILFSEWITIVSFVLFAGVYVVLIIDEIQYREIFSTILLGIAFVCVMICLVMNVQNVVLDTKNGPQEISLQQCEYREPGISDGKYSSNYLICGVDQDGNEFKLIITKKMYNEIHSVAEVEIEYYANCRRVIALTPMAHIEEATN